MKSFRQWLEQYGEVDEDGWRAEKKEVIDAWKGFDPNTAFSSLRIIPKGHRGSTLPYDGLRINGSPEFINTVLSKLKYLLQYEGANTRISVIYKQQIDRKTQLPRPGAYVAYISFKERGSGDS